MKTLRFILPLCFLFFLAGCVDIDENVNINKDGSGQLVMDMDLSQMVEFLQASIGKDELAKKGMAKMDTTIYLKDVVDTLSSMSAEKKALLRPGSVNIKVDLDEKVFKTHMKFPFTSLDNLQKLYATISDGSLGSTQLLKGLVGGQGAADAGSPSPDINEFNGIYDFTCKDGTMIKKLNQEKWKALISDPQVAQAKQAAQMGVEIMYTTTIQFPRPIKNVDNSLAKLSDDKKTVTIKYNLMDLFDHPEQFGYNIAY